MSMEDRKYIKMYPWKARCCKGCNKKTKLEEREKYCENCKNIIRTLPKSLANKIRRGELYSDEAIVIHDLMRKDSEIRERLNSKQSIYSCQERPKTSYEDAKNVAGNLKTFTSARFALELGVSMPTAYNYINRLFDERRITKEKIGKYIIWHSC